MAEQQKRLMLLWDTPSNTSENSLMTTNRPPEKFPDPSLFDTEKLLRELARCREIMLNVPINDPHATHFGVNMAIDTIWQLEQTIRYLLRLHREGQTRFAATHQTQARRAAGVSTNLGAPAKPKKAVLKVA
jgi:hypothetical protein